MDADERCCSEGMKDVVTTMGTDFSFIFRGYFTHLVGGFNPFEKYARQNGNLPKIGVKNGENKKYERNHHLAIFGGLKPSFFMGTWGPKVATLEFYSSKRRETKPDTLPNLPGGVAFFLSFDPGSSE